MQVALCVYHESMNTAQMDDPEFFKFLANSLSPTELNDAFDHYLETNKLTESFESWFNRLPFNADLMNLVHMIYQFDQQGKRDNEQLIVNLAISKRIPKPKTRKPITDAEINAFSDFMASGGLDALLDNKKKNQ